MREEGKLPKEEDSKESIGSILSKERVSQGYSIFDISSYTKLSQSIIERIEKEAFQEIGAPVYVKGYLKIYAEFLGLDYKNILETFDKELPKKPEIKVKNDVGNNDNFVSLKRKKRSKISSAFFVLVFISIVILIYFKFIDPKIKVFISDVDLPNISNEKDPITSQISQVKNLDIKPYDTSDKKEEEEGNNTEKNESASIVPDMPNKKGIKDIEIDIEDNKATEVIVPKVGGDVISDIKDETTELTKEIDNLLTEESEDVNDNNKKDETESHPDDYISIVFLQENWASIDTKNGKKIAEKIFKEGDTIKVDNNDLPLSIRTANPNRMKVITALEEELEMTKKTNSRRVYLLNR